MPLDRNLLLVKGNKATTLVVRSQGLSNEENYLSRESRWLKAIVIADIDCTSNRLKSDELQIGSKGDLKLHFQWKAWPNLFSDNLSHGKIKTVLAYPHRTSAASAASNVGQWWLLGTDLGPIFKCHHWPALVAATDADARCGCNFNSLSKKLYFYLVLIMVICRNEFEHQIPTVILYFSVHVPRDSRPQFSWAIAYR